MGLTYSQAKRALLGKARPAVVLIPDGPLEAAQYQRQVDASGCDVDLCRRRADPRGRARVVGCDVHALRPADEVGVRR